MSLGTLFGSATPSTERNCPEPWIGGSTGCVWPLGKIQTDETGRTADRHGLEIGTNASEEISQQAACLYAHTPSRAATAYGIFGVHASVKRVLHPPIQVIQVDSGVLDAYQSA